MNSRIRAKIQASKRASGTDPKSRFCAGNWEAISNIFRTMQVNRHMAVVVDEYGQTAEWSQWKIFWRKCGRDPWWIWWGRGVIAIRTQTQITANSDWWFCRAGDVEEELGISLRGWGNDAERASHRASGAYSHRGRSGPWDAGKTVTAWDPVSWKQDNRKGAGRKINDKNTKEKVSYVRTFKNSQT